MPFTAADIRAASSDEELLKLLLAELNSIFPMELRRDPALFLPQLATAPPGVRAMDATYELDISLALDDLAWHFRNHPDIRLHEETRLGLIELEATEASDVFQQAFAIIEPHSHELRKVAGENDLAAIHDWLNAEGIQAQIDPLNQRLWNLLSQWPNEGLLHYWTAYARKYPRRCVV